jgi:DNA-binding LacI/PurR family transcriptional regulator
MPKTAIETTSASSSPLVNTILQTLTDRIRAGQYAGPEGFPAERELVEEFSVSRNLVRRVLDQLEEGDLIVRAPRCRTVVRFPVKAEPSGAGQLGRSGAQRVATEPLRRTLSFSVWPGENDPATSAVLRGIYSVLDHSAYRLLMGHVTWNPWAKEQHTEQLFLDQMAKDPDIAGILLWHHNGQAKPDALWRVREAGIPLVFLDCQPPNGFEADFIGVDNEQAALRAVRHLVTMGHRQIAHITNMDSASTVVQRLVGYQQGLEAAGLSFRPELVVQATESSTAEAPAVYGAMLEELLALPDPPTAVFAVNDITALRFIKAVVRSGRRVPEDIAVVGFDGLERWMDRPAFLTTVTQPFEQMGEMALRSLLRQIESAERNEAPTYHRHLLEAPLQVYGSTDFFRR